MCWIIKLIKSLQYTVVELEVAAQFQLKVLKLNWPI